MESIESQMWIRCICSAGGLLVPAATLYIITPYKCLPVRYVKVAPTISYLHICIGYGLRLTVDSWKTE